MAQQPGASLRVGVGRRRPRISDWSEFTAWCTEHRLEPLPAGAATISGYLTELGRAGAKVGTMSRRLSAIRFAHQLRDLPDPTTGAQVVAVWEGIRRTRRPAARSPPSPHGSAPPPSPTARYCVRSARATGPSPATYTPNRSTTSCRPPCTALTPTPPDSARTRCARIRHLRPPTRRLRSHHHPPNPPPLPGHRRHLRPHRGGLGRQRRHPARALTHRAPASSALVADLA